MSPEYKHSDITEKIIKAAFEVFNTLGYGFLEKVYENALYIELVNAGLKVKRQHAINVLYKGEPVGDYIADLIVEDKVIIEIKAISQLNTIHEVQLVNYLKATGIEVGLLINFGPKIKVTRKIFDR